jgi:ribonuclease J
MNNETNPHSNGRPAGRPQGSSAPGNGPRRFRRSGAYRNGNGPRRTSTGGSNTDRGPRGPRRTGEGTSQRTADGAREKSTSGTGTPRKRNGRGGGNRNRNRRKMTNPALTHRIAERNHTSTIPELMEDDAIRIITISGVEGIGRNMIIIENTKDIVVVDAGFAFVSESSKAPGVNYILPNTQYLEERKHKIRAMIVTHGHLDHIGGIPFVMERIGNPPIYTQYLTSLMILKRQEEFPHLEPVDMQVVKEGETFTVGSMRIKTFPVTHSIPDAMGLAFETPHGDVVITGDIRLTHENGEVSKEEQASWGKVGQNNNLVMLCDSTNADRPGFSTPESFVFEALENIIKDATGRLIIGTFASQFERLIHVIKMAEKYGKYVVPEGRSIKTHIDIAMQAKMLEVKPGVIINVNDMQDYPSDRIVVLATGAQGEEFAALMRMATDKHKQIVLTERDTIVLSSSVIPGNEIAVQILKDNIYRKNVRVINYKSAAVHSSGHGNAGELNWAREQVKPKFLIPVHGHHYHLKSHMYTAMEHGFPRQNIVVPDDGTIIDIIGGEQLVVHKEKAPNESVYVDGFTVGARQEVVLRDRQSLAEQGMFVIIATVNTRTGKLRKSPDIISRGFIYLRENQQVLSEARVLIKRTVEKFTERQNPVDLDSIKDELADTVSGFLMQKTNKSPMVIPVLIGI